MGVEIDNIGGQILELDVHKEQANLSVLEMKVQLDHLNNCEKKLSNMLYKHNSYLAKVRDMLAKAYSNVGEYSKAAEFTRKSVSATSERFGPKSIEAGHEILKFTDLIFAQMQKDNYKVDESLLLESLKKA